jgi:hypothetical protein
MTVARFSPMVFNSVGRTKDAEVAFQVILGLLTTSFTHIVRSIVRR